MDDTFRNQAVLGTLTHPHKLPEFAKPSSKVLSVLKRLASQENTYVYILSGRCRHHLDEWFESTGCGLSAEHGCYYKHPASLRDFDPTGVVTADCPEAVTPGSVSAPSSTLGITMPSPVAATARVVYEEGSTGWYRLVDFMDQSWRETIGPLFQHYTERTPGSFIEEKEVGEPRNVSMDDHLLYYRVT